MSRVFSASWRDLRELVVTSPTLGKALFDRISPKIVNPLISLAVPN